MPNRLTRGKALIGSLVLSGDVSAAAASATSGITIGGGTQIKKATSGSANVSWASIPAGGSASATFTVTGAAVGDAFVFNTANTLSSASVAISHGGVSAANTVAVWALNAGAASVAASVNLRYLWVDIT